MPLPSDIRDYHAAQSPADRKICAALAKAIDARLLGKNGPDGVERKVWHRHPVWFIDDNPIVGYHKLKGTKKSGECIRLLFWSGQSFDEPAESGLVPDPPGTKFKTAAARFTSVNEIPTKSLDRWLTKAIDIQWDYKNIVKRKGKLIRLKPDRAKRE